MEIFLAWLNLCARVPAWVPLLLLPALVPVSAIFCGLLRRKKFYLPTVSLLGAVGGFLMACGEVPAAFCYLFLFFVLGIGCFPFTFLKIPKKGERKSRAEKLYGMFREEEEVLRPPKVNCFEPAKAEEGTDVTHAKSLIAKLEREKLSPADRLELDALSRTVQAAGTRPPDKETGELLSDALASVLRLTAKYKL